MHVTAIDQSMRRHLQCVNMDAQWSSIDNKMPSEAPALPTQTEKPSHYM